MKGWSVHLWHVLRLLADELRERAEHEGASDPEREPNARGERLCTEVAPAVRPRDEIGRANRQEEERERRGV